VNIIIAVLIKVNNKRSKYHRYWNQLHQRTEVGISYFSNVWIKGFKTI